MSGVIQHDHSEMKSATSITLSNGKNHPLLDMPFTVSFGGRNFSGTQISLVEAVIHDVQNTDIEASSCLAVFLFPFNDLVIGLKIDIDIYRDEQTHDTLLLKFSDPTGAHLAQLRYILNSYIAGDIINAGEVLQIVNEEEKPKKHISIEDKRGLPWLTRVIRGTFATAAVAGLVLIVSSLAYNKFFVSEVPGLATVVSDGQVVRSAVSGQILRLSPEAKKGEVLAVIQSSRGEFYTVAMPCDCVMSFGENSVGNTILSGDAIATLSSKEDAVFVQASIPASLAKKMLGGAIVEFALPDGRVFDIKPVANENIVHNIDSSGEDIVANLELETAHAIDLIGSKGILSVRESSTAPVFKAVRDQFGGLVREVEISRLTHNFKTLELR